MKIGILTGGGDCPGLNPAIRAVVRKAIKVHGWEVVGFRNGWAGVLEKDTIPLTLDSISGILTRGGTILGSSRTNPFKEEGGPEKAIANLRELGIDALVPIGGDDTLGVASRLTRMGAPCVAIPKTIDGDIQGTEYTIGLNTAVTTAVEAIDRLHSTAESHHRIMIVEVMGRHAGWVATLAGLAGGADFIMIPERPTTIDTIHKSIQSRQRRGKDFHIIVVAEGALLEGAGMVTQSGEKDAFGHVQLGGIGYRLAQELKKREHKDVRVSILGHTVRGGTPTVYDRIIATRYGLKAVDLIAADQFGRMVCLRDNKVDCTDIHEVEKNRFVPDELFAAAEIFFG